MVDYQTDYMRRIEDDYKRMDFAAWKQGEYVMLSIASALNPKKVKYPEHPHSIDKLEEPQQNVVVQARKFEDWANTWNKGFKQKSITGTE